VGDIIPFVNPTRKGLLTVAKEKPFSALSTPDLNRLLSPKFDRMTAAMSRIKPAFEVDSDSFEKGVKDAFESFRSGLKDDEELVVYYTNGVEIVKVGHIHMSSSNVAVISGLDGDGNAVRVISHFKALQFVLQDSQGSARAAEADDRLHDGLGLLFEVHCSMRSCVTA
jgi:hypothetical protein